MPVECLSGGTLFEEWALLRWPVDGYDLENLIPILEKLRDSTSNKPVLLHLKTTRDTATHPLGS
jgi:1-deoxy-D-xylulose-5-phosphate synthase